MQQQQLLSWTIPRPSPPFPVNPRTRTRITFRSPTSSLSPKTGIEAAGEILPNALRRQIDPTWSGVYGFSLGVDLGNSRTGLALGKGFSPRALTVLELRGQKLELSLLAIAEKEEVDEFIIGLPKSSSGKETPQSNKVRSIAGRLAVRAAERGWRVYLQDEHGSSLDALDYMIEMGLKKSTRQGKIDAYSAVMVLERYFSMSGRGAELVLPKQLELQERLRKSLREDADFSTEDTSCSEANQLKFET